MTPRSHLAYSIFLAAVILSGRPGEGADQPRSFPPKSDSHASFAVIGDYGADGPSETGTQEKAVADLIKSWNPEFIVTLGDNNYSYGEASTIDANIGKYYRDYIGSYHGTLTPWRDPGINRFFPSLGNHDWNCEGCSEKQDPKPYRDYFALPGNKRWYDFKWGPVHFFCLDSDPRVKDGGSPASPQGVWLKTQLAASDRKYRVVYFHHPAYSSSNHGDDPRMQWPFKEWGADLVMAGHDHSYERLVVGGLTYIVNGLGGQARYTFRPTPSTGSQIRFASDHGAMRVDANSTRLKAEFITRAGKQIDEFTISPHHR